jgi:hypothetical protein
MAVTETARSGRLRVEQQSEHAPADPPDDIVPVELLPGDDGQGVLPAVGRVLRGRRLDHQQVLGRDHPQPGTLELAHRGLLLPEDLEQPVGVVGG